MAYSVNIKMAAIYLSKEYKICKVTKMLGVSYATLARWLEEDRSSCVQHPQNGSTPHHQSTTFVMENTTLITSHETQKTVIKGMITPDHEPNA